jgi:hypothetical protein
MAGAICNPARLDERALRGKVPADAAELVRRAAAFWDNTPLSPTTRAALERYAAGALATATQRWQRDSYPVLTENALRMLVAVSPDYLTA